MDDANTDPSGRGVRLGVLVKGGWERGNGEVETGYFKMTRDWTNPKGIRQGGIVYCNSDLKKIFYTLSIPPFIFALLYAAFP